ncbi:MAG: methyltransferase domain-containing protein [Pirellulales bacterium]|nr:methyltransferase domain-containing protein [Pirellulales bacterium]
MVQGREPVAAARDAHTPLAGKHVVVFLMSYPGLLGQARPLIYTLHRAGCRVTVVFFSFQAVFPLEEISDADVAVLTLSDQGTQSIPRLTREQYRQLCGDDLDFGRLTIHESFVAGLPVDRNWLFLDSFHYQRYRGFAWRAEQLLAALRPDFAIVPHTSEPLSKLVYAKCRLQGVPTLVSESAFFPGNILLDPVGMHFYWRQNLLERDWPRVAATPLTAAEQHRLDRFRARLIKGGVSKYPQPTNPDEWERLQARLQPGKKLLFFPGQVPSDANVFNGLGGFASYSDLVHWVRDQLPDDWQVVFKSHPYASVAGDAELERPNFHVVRNVGIHRLLERADAVCVHSSNVGLEALLLDRPVIACGRPYYAGRGLTLDLNEPRQWTGLLDAAPAFRVDQMLRDRLLHYIAFHYLIAPGDTAALVDRLQQATCAARTPEGPWAPFTELLPEVAERYVALQRRYNQLAFQNYSHQEAVARLALDGELPADTASAVEADPVRASERWVGQRIGEIAPEFTQRYAFAAQLAEPRRRVLDFGCGTGFGSYLLAQLADVEVTAVDPATLAIDEARRTWSDGRIDYVCASAGTWEMPSGQFDLIVAHGVCEYAADDRRLVAQLWHGLRPGGRLVLSVPSAETENLVDHVQRIRHYTPLGLRALIAHLPAVAAAIECAQTTAEPVRPEIQSGSHGERLLLIVERELAHGHSDLAERVAALLPYRELPEGSLCSPAGEDQRAAA